MIRYPRVCAFLVALGALAAAPSSFAACDYPPKPGPFPDGSTAKLEEMVAAQKGVKQFMAAMDGYLKCVDEENPPAPAGTKLTDAQKKEQDAREKIRVEKHNAAVTDEETVAETFNVQLHAYKDAQAKK
ncbi:MAG TPA: hypothetical protein VN790_04340 [Steroidobacteraceae bacterium]|nr:hypothetical protein [Steroidobacteraceae bacterium]